MSLAALGFFRAPVAAITDLTPSFRRFTFRDACLADYGDPGFDQRVKVIFPTATASLDDMPTGPDWYEQWRALPEAARPVMRTYTTRAVRASAHEVDIDMVAHDVIGPASAFIADAQVGDEVLILAPTTAHTGVSYGIDFVPPAETDAILLAGDETAAPAIAVILEQLPPEARGTVVLEVPTEADLAYLPRHPGFDLVLAARDGEAQRHAHLVTAVEAVAESLAPAGIGAEVEEVDVDTDILWEVPRTAKGGAALKRAPLYAWLAGEASAIKTLRRHLVGTVGVDRRAVAFMGYWRVGRSET
ncbi:siderophore-interacting protein [Microbacterium imperiale]|uniref:Siderophore-interacting protein n=1 Tax=Microbacterium imperiale TaxID=33884 RepID=A0A9W6HF00_9MICO|nr:siderophore-interacting protein [Microbacterium imperiale]MBP2419850.1 NADPH-dependent ferric siderophore reductase [Microbacterium imperiale]MDS0198286.1 siderophore-interacting protein [Microbacterium imperiale]BFE40190.1 siderophore-interacting protein [Microbacterium imperiale]GLJ78834.1 siderophore-interacting protein [Microbacterium imperiale]